jgi:PAS domain S-box-containing protein
VVVAGALVSVASLIVVVHGIRRWAPDAASAWWIIAAAALSFLVGRAVLAIQAAAGGGPAPFPSPADAFFLVGYALMIAGTGDLVRRRSASVEDDSLVDAVIVATAVGVVVLAYVVYPYLSEPSYSSLEKFLTATYAMADVVLVAVVVRLAVGAGKHPPSYYLLVGCISGMIVTDALTTLYGLEPVAKPWIVACSAVCYVLLAGAVAHPSMAQLTDSPVLREVKLSRRRLALLCAALLLVPALLTFDVALGDGSATAVLAAGSVVMGLLVIARLAGLVRAKERKAARERALRTAAADLVVCTGREEIYAAAARALLALAEANQPWARTSIAAGEPEAMTVVTSEGHRSHEATGTAVAADLLPPAARAMFASRAPAVIEETAPIDLVGRAEGPDQRTAMGEEQQAHVLLVPLWSRETFRGAFVVTTARRLAVEPTMAIETLAGQVALALDSAALVEEFHARRHERRFRALVEYSSDLISVMGADGMLRFVSPASTGLLGIAPEDLVGRPALELVHPDDRVRVSAILTSAAGADAPPEPVELRLQQANGRWRWFEVIVNDASGVPDVGGLVIHARDVTDRKAAETRLAENEARFRSLVQNASDLIVVVDETLRVTYASPSVTGVLGYEAERIVGGSGLDLIHPDDATPALRLIAGRSPDDPSPTAIELRLRNAAGTWLNFDVSVRDLRADPAIAGIVLNGHDITDRRQSEERWRAFGAQASHQLRTPLTGMRLSIENSLAQAHGGAQGELRDILEQVERLESTVEDFLALAPRRRAAPAALDVHRIVADLDGAWRGVVESAGRELVTRVDSPLPLMRCSDAAARQVLGVLIENALKHGTGAISVVARKVAGGVALEVSDEGTGIEPDGPRRRSDGTGMGLDLARALAEAEGGRLLLRRRAPSPTVAFLVPSHPPPSAAAVTAAIGG